MDSKDKDYRLITLITDICPIPLRKYFLDLAKSDTSSKVPFTTLDQYMVNRHSHVKTLKSIRQDQYNLIYPKADETKWDVTLLSALLLGLFENQMKKGENSLIKVIREKRNKLQHTPGSVITDDAEFDLDWEDIENATKTLAQIVGGTTFENEVTKQIQAVKVNNLPRLGDTLRSWYEDIIIELKNKIEELKEETVKIKKTSESSLQILQSVSHKRPISKGAPAKKVLKTVDVRVNKLRDNFRQTIGRELPEDFKCQPDIPEEILRILQENHCVVVTGSENTSYLATVLSAIIRSEKYPLDRCFELKTVDDWNSIDPYETDLILFTEPFVEQQNESRLQQLFQSMLDTSKESRIDVVIVSEISRVNHWKENHDDNEIFKNVVKVFMPTDENNPLNLEGNTSDKRHGVGGFLGNMIDDSAQEPEQTPSTDEAVKPKCADFVKIDIDKRFYKEFCEVSDGTIVCSYQTDPKTDKWFIAIFSLESLKAVESMELAYVQLGLFAVQGTKEIIILAKGEDCYTLQSAAVGNSSIKLGKIEKTPLKLYEVKVKIAKIDQSDLYIVCSKYEIKIYDLKWTKKNTICYLEDEPLFYNKYFNNHSPASKKKNITDLTLGLKKFFVSSLVRIFIFNLEGVMLERIPSGSERTCIFNDQMLITLNETTINIFNYTNGEREGSFNIQHDARDHMYYSKKNKRLFVANLKTWWTCDVKTE